MTREETVKLLKTLEKSYPKHFKDLSKIDAGMMIDEWYRTFLDYDYVDVLSKTEAWNGVYCPYPREILATLPPKENGEDLLRKYKLALNAYRTVIGCPFLTNEETQTEFNNRKHIYGLI